MLTQDRSGCAGESNSLTSSRWSSSDAGTEQGKSKARIVDPMEEVPEVGADKQQKAKGEKKLDHQGKPKPEAAGKAQPGKQQTKEQAKKVDEAQKANKAKAKVIAEKPAQHKAG